MDSPRKMLSGDVSHSPDSHDSSPGRLDTAPRGQAGAALFRARAGALIGLISRPVSISTCCALEKNHDSANESAYSIQLTRGWGTVIANGA